MELRNKYFHGVQSYNYYGNFSDRRDKTLNDILHKYECIFKCGYILPYRNIQEIYGNIDRHSIARYNGEDKVSISLHEKSPETTDIEWMNKHHDYEENAFRIFIFQGGYNSSIVLNETIKDNYKLIPSGIYLERQVPGPISLEYMDAISIFPNSEIARYFEIGEDLKKHGHYYQDDFNIEFLYRLRGLLIKYGYNVPIVSIVTGHEFIDNQDNVRKLCKKYH